ncbi:hypothetical protein GCM10009102_33880 [Sphingomonas insulae]|uniref:Uncharacterized protein n=2 Tax=Sphingomonas insulae TaxID=424800 RepID=A0ABN1I0E3_9SPHN
MVASGKGGAGYIMLIDRNMAAILGWQRRWDRGDSARGSAAMDRNDTSYLSDRSFVEAVRSIQASHPAAAAAHHAMCRAYTEQVLARLAAGRAGR